MTKNVENLSTHRGEVEPQNIVQYFIDMGGDFSENLGNTPPSELYTELLPDQLQDFDPEDNNQKAFLDKINSNLFTKIRRYKRLLETPEHWEEFLEAEESLQEYAWCFVIANQHLIYQSLQSISVWNDYSNEEKDFIIKQLFKANVEDVMQNQDNQKLTTLHQNIRSVTRSLFVDRSEGIFTISNENPEDLVIQAEEIAKIWASLDSLTDGERKLIERMFLFAKSGRLTVRELADLYLAIEIAKKIKSDSQKYFLNSQPDPNDLLTKEQQEILIERLFELIKGKEISESDLEKMGFENIELYNNAKSRIYRFIKYRVNAALKHLLIPLIQQH